MKLSGKTFVYSIGISAVLVGMILLYFVFMLPSLYVDYMNEQNLQSAVELERGYLKSGSYKGLKVGNPTSSATFEIPFEGNTLYLTGKSFQLTFTVKDESVLGELEKLQGYLKNMEELQEAPKDTFDFELLKELLLPEGKLIDENDPVEVRFFVDETEELYENKGIKVHVISDELQVLETHAGDQENEYTAYFVFGKTEDASVISVVSVMTPKMHEIKEIVLGSLPMIAAVLFFLVLICSQFFSGKIVNPIIRLARYAESVQGLEASAVQPFPVGEGKKDEIGELGEALNELYGRLKRNYLELEEKNHMLEQENKRREVFLRASSHQLKTPVSAALLLVDGMLDGVGKYKDTRAHLPRVKEKLLEMRDIINDILYLNHCTEHLKMEDVALSPLVWEVLACYQIQAEEQRLTVRVEEGLGSIYTDRELFKKMIDNLIANAVHYTEEGGRLLIRRIPGGLSIYNEKARIPEALAPHLYEPFVSSESEKKGKGLGLYIASYYGDSLGLSLSVENQNEGVEARVVR